MFSDYVCGEADLGKLNTNIKMTKFRLFPEQILQKQIFCKKKEDKDADVVMILLYAI